MADEWDRQLAAFAESLVILPRLVEATDRGQLERAPAPGEWSAHVVVCHLLLDEINTSTILRLILTQDAPLLASIDADNALCETRFAPLYPDTSTALGVWRVLREDNVRLCARVSPPELERVGLAPWRSRQRISFREHISSRVGHDRAHVEQIQCALGRRDRV